jgi:hypothetical protein
LWEAAEEEEAFWPEEAVREELLSEPISRFQEL